MDSLVLELQADAMDENKSIIFLLRKARAVSIKLNVTTIQEWIEHELEGYPCEKAAPDYRGVTGQLMCRNPLRGFIPWDVDNHKWQTMLTQRRLENPLPVLIDFLNKPSKSRKLMVGFPPEASSMLMDMMTRRFEPWLAIEISAVQRIVASVRTKILDFALELEQQGVLGAGMTFSRDEKQRASTIHYNINIEKMSGSQIQQGTTKSTQSYNSSPDLTGIASFVEKILPAVGSVSDKDARDQLQIDLETIRSQVKAPTPRLSIIRECLESVRTILEGVAGSVLATQYTPILLPLLASLPS